MKFLQLLAENTFNSGQTVASDELGNPLAIGTFRGVEVSLKVVTIGADTISARLEEIGPVGSTAAVRLALGPISVAGTYILAVHPELTALASTYVAQASAAISSYWRLTISHAGAADVTYSIGAAYLP